MDIIKIISPLLRKYEKSYINKYSKNKLIYEPVFIVGAPRTGSTILYQTITNILDVLYINNLTCRLNKNLIFGFIISKFIYQNRAHNCFHSVHGNTSLCGLNAPSECGSFWYRWFPRDRHYLESNDISEKSISEIKEEIHTLINYFNKPLVINNNNMALRIQLLHKIFPNAKYIIIDREPLLVSQSILKVRKKVFGSYEHWWSMMPKNYDEIIKGKYYNQVVLQHYYINKQLKEDISTLIDKRNIMRINFSEFALNKQKYLEDIMNFIDYNKKRILYKNNEIIEDKSLYLDEKLLDLLQIQINKLDWNDYTS